MNKFNLTISLMFVIISQLSCSLTSPSLNNQTTNDNSDTIPDVVTTPSFKLELETISLENIQNLTLIAEIYQAKDVSIDNFYKSISSIDVSSDGKRMVFATERDGYLLNLDNGEYFELSGSSDDVNFISGDELVLSLPSAYFYSSIDGTRTKYIEGRIRREYAFSQNLLAIWNEDHSISIFDIHNENLIYQTESLGDDYLSPDLAFSPNGNYLLVGFVDDVFVWNRETKGLDHALEDVDGQVTGISTNSFSPDGQHVVIGHHQGFEIYNLNTWQSVLDVGSLELANWSTGNDKISYSPNGKKLLRGNSEVYDAVSGSLMFTLPTLKTPVAFSHDELFLFDGKNIYSGQDGSILSNYYGGNDDRIRALGISPDGRFIYLGFHDGHIAIWGVSQRKNSNPLILVVGEENGVLDEFGFVETQRYNFDQSVEGISWYPDGNGIAIWTSAEKLHVLDVKSNTATVILDYSKQLNYLLDKLVAVCESENEKLRTQGIEPSKTCDMDIELGLAARGNFYHEYIPDWWSYRDNALGFGGDATPPEILKISSDGSQVAVVAITGFKIIDLSSGKIVKEYIPSDLREYYPEIPVVSLQFPENISFDLQFLTFDGGYLFAINENDGTKFEGLQNEIQQFMLPDYVNKIALSPDGKLIFGGGESGLAVWDLSTSQLLQSYTENCSSSTGIFTSDSKFVLTNCGPDKLLWDVDTGQRIELGRGSGFGGERMIISPDNRLILLASHVDTTSSGYAGVTLEVIQSPEQYFHLTIPFEINELVTGLAFSPDSRYFAVSYTDGSVRIFEIHP